MHVCLKSLFHVLGCINMAEIWLGMGAAYIAARTRNKTSMHFYMPYYAGILTETLNFLQTPRDPS